MLDWLALPTDLTGVLLPLVLRRAGITEAQTTRWLRMALDREAAKQEPPKPEQS